MATRSDRWWYGAALVMLLGASWAYVVHQVLEMQYMVAGMSAASAGSR
jgi:hypothetical protein